MAKPTTPFSALLGPLQIDLPQVPEALALDRLREAAREFCEISHAWQELLVIVPAEGVERYTLNLPAGTSMVEVREALQDGEAIEFSLDERETILIPDAGTAPINVVVAVKPSGQGQEAYAGMLEEHRDAIIAGARSRLMLIGGKPWSAPPDLAMMHREQFIAAAGRARRTVENGYRPTRGPRPVFKGEFF